MKYIEGIEGIEAANNATHLECPTDMGSRLKLHIDV